MLVNVDIGHTAHLIQQLHEPFQPRLIKATNVWFQVPVTEKHAKEWSVLVVSGAELLKPFLDIRDRWRVRGDRHSGSLGGSVGGGVLWRGSEWMLEAKVVSKCRQVYIGRPVDADGRLNRSSWRKKGSPVTDLLETPPNPEA